MYYGASRSQSAGPSSMLDQFGVGGAATTSSTTIPRRTAEAAAASHIASPITNRRFYQQQPSYLRHHRSVDGMELIGNDLDPTQWTDGMQQPSVLSQNCANDISASQAFGSTVPSLKLAGAALEQEYELLKRDYEVTLQKLHATMNSIKTFWSPELKKERQMRKEEAQKVLLMQQKMAMPYSQNEIGVAGLGPELEKLRMELNIKEQTINTLMEMNRCDPNSVVVARRIADLEARCNHLDAVLATKDDQLRAYQQKLSQVSSIGYEDTVKEARIAELEDELKRMKIGAVNRPLDFTNKSISTHELHTLKMKMEKSEMELAHRSNELSSAQAKLRTAEESNGDLSRHVQLLKESLMAKEQQITLLHEDVDALRKKLETKNQLIEHRDVTIKNLETMLENVRAQLADSSQTVKDGEQKMSQMNRRIDQLESAVRERENELEGARQRLQAQPDVIFEKEMKMRLENAERDKLKLQQNIDEIRNSAEVERHEQLEAFKEQARKDRLQIESLQKELSDRQILLESQNEKIGDLDGELKRKVDSGKMLKMDLDKTKLRAELEEAHSEVDRLLKIVQNLEKERTALTTKCSQLQTRTVVDSISSETSGRGSNTLKNRIDELEEALRESVSITAEREMHVAQQKQANNQLTTQLNDALREVATLRKELHETSRGKDNDTINRAFEKERQKHLEQLLQLKHEAIVAALGEKDAHIALLEMSPREDVRDQLDTLRKHREKLMQKLKIENERRAKLMEQINASPANQYVAPVSGVGIVSMDSGLGGVQNTNDQDDDAEGIWA